MHLRMVVIVIAVFLLTGCDNPGSVNVENVWVRPPAPNMQMTAAYMVIRNTTKEPRTLIQVESQSIEVIEMHKTETIDGVSRMRQQEHVVVDANDVVTFEPGGLHLMLIGFLSPVSENSEVDFVLSWQDGSQTEITGRVTRGHP
ncbi:MAG: copper chaperone PCu(A)C [Pseudomonadota bacterium]